MTIPIGSGHGVTNVEGHEDFDIVWPWNQPGGLRRGATAEVRTDRPLDEVVAAVLAVAERVC